MIKDLTEGEPRKILWQFPLPMFISVIFQQSFVSVGNIFIQRLVNGYGSSVIAGYSAAIKINTFGVTCFGTLGNAVSNFTAQNIGAERNDRVKKGFHASLIMGFLIGVPFVRKIRNKFVFEQLKVKEKLDFSSYNLLRKVIGCIIRLPSVKLK